MKTLISAIALSLFLGCSDSSTGPHPTACTADEQCGTDEVCFHDGCGSPERDLMVEVVPDARAGLNAQDFALTDFRSTQDLELHPPAAIFGQVFRGGEPYTGKVTLKLLGGSELIPGRDRTYGGPLSLYRGDYAIATGTGLYTLTVLPADTAIPPTAVREVRIAPGQLLNVSINLPAAADLLQLTGTVTRVANSSTRLDVPVEVQTVDPVTQRPLSQRVTIDPATGAFSLMTLRPEGQGFIGLQATPRETASGSALVPRKLFTVPLKAVAPVLELGDFGKPVTVSGRLLGSDGSPIASATVYLEGQVSGGGFFTSARVTSDLDGKFSGLATLPSDPLNPFTLWAVPSARSNSGVLRTAVKVTAAGGFLGEFSCPDRVPVQGQVKRPDGRDYAGVKVKAHALSALEPGQSVSSLEVETTTDENSAYTLHLDPGVWRLDYIAPEPMPRASREVTVRADVSSLGGNKILTVPPLQFSKGRTVIGTVTALPNAAASLATKVPFAAVRYFRVATVNGHGTSELLAEIICDDQAGYSVSLPAR